MGFALRIGLSCLALGLAGCTTAQKTGDAAGRAIETTGSGLTDAALSPLEDLNLRKQEIPPILVELDWPYELPDPVSCEAIEREVIELSAVLGPDIDFPPPDDERSRVDWAADESADAALGFVAGEARSLIPFRGILRELTGANDHASAILRAYRMGQTRRAYLKGIGSSLDCQWPAAPLPQPLDDIEPSETDIDEPASITSASAS